MIKRSTEHIMKYTVFYWTMVGLSSGCTFNFELTSQRTALENQVMGVYQELDDEVFLLSTMRGPRQQRSQKPDPSGSVVFHRRNQEFNRDDIEELKEKGIVGERWDGLLEEVGGDNSNKDGVYPRELVKVLVNEENSDRRNIWRYVLSRIPEGSGMTLSQIGEAYGKSLLEKAVPGFWLKDKNGVWHKKT
jgi:uncharacterized protein YdbL (DUF1318 family)